MDGFRFDLASVLARDGKGHPLSEPPLLEEIETDPILAGTKIIAEAWDAAGLYQVGSFVGSRWAVWNDRYRDDVRRFVKGDPDTVAKLAARIVGSPDLFPDRGSGRSAEHQLRDLPRRFHPQRPRLLRSQAQRGQRTRQPRRDRTSNHSWNCGVEGPTADPSVQTLRTRQTKNLLTILLCSQGTPMLLMGDEVRRTQRGNNNAYCQDNEVSWFDWDAPREHCDMLRFVKRLLHFRHEHGLFRQDRTWSGPSEQGPPPITWHGVQPYRPDWG